MQTERITSAVSYTASATTATATGTMSAVYTPAGDMLTDFLHGLSYEEWLIAGVIVGMIFCVLTFITNFYFQYRRLKTEEKIMQDRKHCGE